MLQGGMRLISSGQQITRGENGRSPEKYTILFSRPKIANIIIAKKSWFGKKIVQWRRLGGGEGGEEKQIQCLI